MSQVSDGTFVCDRCGAEVGNGSLLNAVVVSDIDPDKPGMVRNMHFCRDRTVDEEEVKGCSRKLLSPSNLKHLNDSKESISEPASPGSGADDEPA